MAVCKECGALNPDSNKYCSECGQPIVKLDSKAIRDAMSQMEAEFEQDALVNLDRSRLTYICDVCGKVNPIDEKQCLRCGKKRPRSEYINALTKIKSSRNLKKDVKSMSETEEKAVTATVLPEKKAQDLPTPPPAPVLPKEEAKEQGEETAELSLYRLTPQSQTVEQNRQIVQPFVIVPYVSQNQPLLQYDPNEVYRYMPYTNEEKKLEAERQARLAANAEQLKQAQESELRGRKKETVEAMLSRKKAQEKRLKKTKRPRRAKVSVCSLIALFIAAAGIFAAFAELVIQDFKVLRFAKEPTILEFFSFGNMSFDGTRDILTSLYVIFVLIFLIVLALCAVQCLVRLITGRIRKKGFVNMMLPLLSLIFAIGIAAIYLVLQLAIEPTVEFSALFAEGAVFGWIVAIVVAVLLCVFYGIAGARKKKSIRR